VTGDAIQQVGNIYWSKFRKVKKGWAGVAPPRMGRLGRKHGKTPKFKKV